MANRFFDALKVAAVLMLFPALSYAAIVINEFDYDQPGTDDAEFIELYNSGGSSVSLDGYVLDLINGSTGSAYRSFDLSGFVLSPNDYFVVCGNMATVTNCNFDIGASTNRLQNDNEGIALFNGTSLIDSVTYEGVIAPYTEGMLGTLADPGGVAAISLSRLLNGIDTNINAVDFALGCATPGSGNIANNGNCASISTVPVPAAVWLFGSGLVGLLGLMRRHRKVIISPVPV